MIEGEIPPSIGNMRNLTLLYVFLIMINLKIILK